MMAVNRYRLKHLARSGHRGAKLAEWLLGRTDQLLGVVLLGNNLINAASASLLTVVAFRLFGADEMVLSLATVVVTFLILVFSEVTPKVIGAAYPDRLAPAASYILVPLLKAFSPVVWFVNLFVQGLLRIFRLQSTGDDAGNRMGAEELRTVLAESGSFLPSQHRSLLLNLFDLEKLTVDDAMLPRGEIEALDLEEGADDLLPRLANSQHAHIPVYRGELNDIVGILNVRRALASLRDAEFDPELLREAQRAPYYIPSGTPLLTQLGHFQENRQSMGLVVDEYGELIGLVTVEDILEEIVGEFTGAAPLVGRGWVRQPDGAYLVDGTANLRNLNRKLGMALPMAGPRTLNGLILEHLESMPEVGVSIKIAGCVLEIVQMQERVVKTVRIQAAVPESE